MVDAVAVRVITLRRAVTVVAIALVAALATRLLMMLAATSAATSAAAASPGSWAGIGVAFLGAAAAVLTGYILAVVIVAIGMRRRNRAGLFVGVFAAMLGMIVLLPIVALQWGGLALPLSLDGSPLSISYLLTVPLLVVIPAAVAGAIPWKRAGIVAAGGVALVLVASIVATVADNSEQQRWNAAYEGPAYVPSTSPGSPLEGFTLRGVDLLNEYNTDYVHLSYVKRDGDDETYYDLHFYTGLDRNLCLEENDSCTLVGEALGSPVYSSSSVGTYYVVVDKGTVALQGYIEPEDALTVLNDLEPASIEDIAALAVTPQ